MFFKDKATICNYQDNTSNSEIIDDVEDSQPDCGDYEYSWEKGKITIYVYPEDVVGSIGIVYTYIFNENDELVLTYSGDGFDYKFYYQAAIG